jgi:SnoaL-like domain
MKDIVRILLRVILLFIILLLVTRIFKRADEKMILSPAKSFYSKGNAPDSTRMEIIDLLNKFQDGYSKRDLKNIDTFMQSLYSRENILILETMPSEIYSGHEKATRLVKSDWDSWGDCKFEIDSANISSSGNTAWFSTKGYVKFDLSNLLVIPLRLTGIMVKEDHEWKFQQQQFQFDIDFSFNLIATLVISGWILISIITLSIKMIKMLRKSN